jgi:hypothetical protein
MKDKLVKFNRRPRFIASSSDHRLFDFGASGSRYFYSRQPEDCRQPGRGEEADTAEVVES